MEKICKTCDESKGLEFFSPVKRGKLGRAADCKRCAADKKASWRAANPDRVLAANQKYYTANAERMRANKREYNAHNADRRAEYMSQYRQDNPTARRDWGRANPDKITAQQHKRRALRLSSPHEPYTVAEILEDCDYRCAYCDAPAEHLDHIMPIAKGGADAAYNVTGSCAVCNQMKGAMDPEVWIARVLASDKPLWAL